MLATIPSATLRGIDGAPVRVEVHVANGIPAFSVVGLPDASCREARDRVRAAILVSKLEWPRARITVNLAPSGIRKEGAALDLAIAIGILAAAGELEPECVEGVGFIGELGLDGTLRRVPGTLALADAVDEPRVVVAPSAAGECALAVGDRVRVAASLDEVIRCLRAESPWRDPPPPGARASGSVPDLADVRGQPLARLAVEVSAAGRHNLLMVGPPGAGKTMLAKRLPGLLDDLASDVALTVTRVHSCAGLPLPPSTLVAVPPFRAPHHTASVVALVGGGYGRIRPGEISCAHGGVLFLDELGEFPPAALDALRQPLEEGVIRIARAHGAATLPARFLLVAAMNPCPCGFLGTDQPCRCSDAARARYARRVSGPLLDRFDLRVFVNRPEIASLLSSEAGEATAVVLQRVQAARARAGDRGVAANSELASEQLDSAVELTADAHEMLVAALEQCRLTARGYNRVRAVARTLADLSDLDVVDTASVAVALQLRSQPLHAGLVNPSRPRPVRSRAAGATGGGSRVQRR